MGTSKKSDLNRDIYQNLHFVVDDNRLKRFFLLLQQGFMLKAHVGCSIKSFLTKEIGISPDTLERIQTIFLDGKPVDNLDTAIIKDGSILALSAAMPGLVGATLRRGGVYSSFRSSITYREANAQCITGEGFVQLKLFNVLMDELGPDFLRKGILVKSSDLIALLKGQSRDFWQGCKNILIDGKPAEPGLFEDNAWLSRHDRVHLSVAIQK